MQSNHLFVQKPKSKNQTQTTSHLALNPCNGEICRKQNLLRKTEVVPQDEKKKTQVS